MADDKITKHTSKKFINLSGLRFGRLLVISVADNRNKMTRWNCLCDCGKTTVVFGNSLRRGLTQSCGCYKRDWTISQFTTHNKTESHEYKCWCTAKQRCFNPHCARYKNYGGRGITMCDEWRDSFEQFFLDMGPCPEGKELDRINNDGNYEKANCHWTDRKTNMRNRQNALKATYDGQTLPLKEWVERTGIRYETLIYRMRRGLPLLAPIGNTGPRRNK